MSTSFDIQELAKVVGVDEVSVDADGETKRRVYVEGLCLRCRRSAGGGISDVGNAESTRQLLQESQSIEFRKDLLRHSEALPLVDSTPVANRDAGSILTSVLEIKETLVEFDGSRSGLRVSEHQTSDATHFHGGDGGFRG